MKLSTSFPNHSSTGNKQPKIPSQETGSKSQKASLLEASSRGMVVHISWRKDQPECLSLKCRKSFTAKSILCSICF